MSPPFKQTKGKIMPFVTTYHPGVKNLKQILMQKWSLIQNQPLLKTIYTTPPILSYKKGNRSKICSSEQNFRGPCAATAKPHRGVCVGLSTTFTMDEREGLDRDPVKNSINLRFP